MSLTDVSTESKSERMLLLLKAKNKKCYIYANWTINKLALLSLQY